MYVDLGFGILDFLIASRISDGGIVESQVADMQSTNNSENWEVRNVRGGKTHKMYLYVFT
jgi:hypothetical protein